MRRPAAIEATVTPAMVGAIRRPELVADTPDTACRNSGKKMVEVNMQAEMRNPITTDTVTTVLRKRRSGSKGSGTLASHQTNRIPRTTAAADSPAIRLESQGYCLPPHTETNIRQETDATSSRLPR